MDAEYNMIKQNDTSILVETPIDHNVIGVKWIFRTKLNPDGSINKYKTRLVVKGYAQVYGADYLETFALVARHDTIRMLVGLPAKKGPNSEVLLEFKTQMMSVFEMINLRLMTYFLSMEVV
ncbi:PREDICTED: uncharacterized mitochondrial protein AtMg00820-like [Theobroma cacao]|uniref:Uncharacterized mitochondrial protein AtMg00820-like n=1 Tax=Theobroma cacao TaxID=3641 RepID=A0AB32WT92_THECC|nr:PREDICTED: uncharacterized mitochondrial protein AtMg00820-like [Theobroma cacao]